LGFTRLEVRGSRQKAQGSRLKAEDTFWCCCVAVLRLNGKTK
jgi:hypothetical protein